MNAALVTGGSGFIGRALVAELVRRGIRVRATARSPQAAAEVAAAGAEPVAWSLESPALPQAALDGIGTVFHLACPRRIYDAAVNASRRPGSAVLEGGTLALARQVAAMAGIRFVLTGSASVYGKIWGEVDESAVPSPRGRYAEARVASERAAETAFAEAPDRLVRLRLTEVVGPGDQPHRAMFRAIAEGRFRMIGDGRAVHHVSLLPDVVAGVIAAAEAAQAGGQVLNIGSPARPFAAMVAAAARAADRPVRATPALQGPAALALRAMRAVPPLERVFALRFAQLDYQVRPRAYGLARAEAVLGRYATADFDGVVADSLRVALAQEGARAGQSVTP